MKEVILSNKVQIDTLARITPGFSGADLANVVNEAALLASRRGKKAVEPGDFDEAIEKVLTGSERRSHAMNQKEKKVVAVHEAGHAIVAGLLPNTDPVHKVSIVPRGKALGYTWQRPTEDRYLLSEGELRNRLAVLLGGRAAESLVLKEVSTGAADDLMRATELARRMITEYGMSPELGPQRLAADPQTVYLGAQAGLDARISPETAAQIDKETHRLVSEAMEQAHTLLYANKKQLIELADELFDKETVSGDQLNRLLRKGKKRESSTAKVPVLG
jgi:cell division protease FtsH